MHSNITLQVNGKVRSFPFPMILPDALQKLGFNSRLVVVEYNGEILHKQLWQSTTIKDGDRLEVVTIFGGG